MEIRLNDLLYVCGDFAKKKLNKAQRKNKKYLESIFIRIEEEMGVPRFVFGTYDDEGFWNAIDSAKINRYEVVTPLDRIKRKL